MPVMLFIAVFMLISLALFVRPSTLAQLAQAVCTTILRPASCAPKDFSRARIFLFLSLFFLTSAAQDWKTDAERASLELLIILTAFAVPASLSFFVVIIF